MFAFISSSPVQALHQSNSLSAQYPTTCRHRTHHESQPPAIYGIYSTPIPDVASPNSSAVNSYEFYDWSTAGQMATSTLTNISVNKPFSDQSLAMKSGNIMQLQADTRQNTNQYFGDFCSEQVNFKRCSTGSQTFSSRKCTEDIADGNPRSNMADTYYHHVTNLI